MKQCGCGDVAEEATGRCSRCAALQVLGLETAASDGEIHSTYRLLVQVWHPDRFQKNPQLKDAAEEKLKEINRAYQFLTSPEGQRRTRYHDSPSADVPNHSDAPDTPPPPYAASCEPRQPRPPGISAWARDRLIVHWGVLLQSGVIFACVAVIGFLLFQRLDSFLLSNPETSKLYGESKARVSADVAVTLGSVWTSIRQTVRLSPSPPASSAANGPENRPPAETPNNQARNTVRPAQPTVVKIHPYITTDLTEEEVAEIQGPPSQATDTKLVYQTSELYFRANHLVGWKIDPSAPLRVKLWPDAVVDQGTRTFTVGSSKNEVIVAQGTPSVLSDNMFGYCGSEVYFENNRVVSWRNDPTTVPLRVAAR